MRHSSTVGSLLCAAMALGGCSSDNDKDDGAQADKPGVTVSAQCEATSYVAFDSANHASQDIRVAVSGQMNELMSSADFETSRQMYLDPNMSANLQEKVQGRLDQHVTGDPLQGERLDDTIVSWLDYGTAAEEALERTVAQQWVSKSLIEFFFLSVHHELLEGARANWDEAFGYFGSGANNDESDLQGLASVAFKRDGANGTNLESEIYNNLIDGACALDTALVEAGLEEIDVHDVPQLESIIEEIDRAMQETLAYSAGHEAYEMAELLEAAEVDTAELTVKASELIPYFIPIERIMNERGGESADRAAEIRSVLDLMPVSDADSMDVGNTAWVDELGDGPERIIEALQAEYGIEIKG